MADRDTLDILRSKAIEQEVLDLLDEPKARRHIFERDRWQKSNRKLYQQAKAKERP